MSGTLSGSNHPVPIRLGDGMIGCALTCGGLNDWLPGNNTNKGGEKEGMLTVILFSVYMYL